MFGVRKFLSKNADREKVLGSMISAIRSSLDFDETLELVCSEIGKSFKANRASIVKIDSNCYNFELSKLIKWEWKAEKEFKGADDTHFNKASFDWAIPKIKEGPIVFENIFKSKAHPDFIKAYEEIGVKSFLAVPVKKADDLWGVVILTEYNSFRNWTKEEINLLEIIADQIYMAVKQAELHAQIKYQAEKAENTTNQLKAILDNLPFMAWLKDNQSRFLAVNKQFEKMYNKTAEELLEKTDFDINTGKLAEKYRKDDIEIMKSGRQIAVEELINGNNGPRWHETFKTPIYDKDGNVIGTTGFAKDITEKKEAELVLKQNQQELIKAHKRETLLRKIITTVRSTLDVNEITNNIVTEVGKAFDADRCYIREQDKRTGQYQPPNKYAEYLSSENVKSLVGLEPNQKALEFLAGIVIKEGRNIIEDTERFISDNNLQNTDVEKFFTELDTKSNYAFCVSVNKNTNILLMLHYTRKKVKFTPEQYEFFQSIADQIGIALNQAEQYQAIKKQLEKERLLRSDNSILVNKNLADNIGLNCAITYSTLMNIFNYHMDESILTKDGFANTSLESIQQHTCLDELEQMNSIEKLTEHNLISYKREIRNKIYYRINEDSELIQRFLSANKADNTKSKYPKVPDKQEIFYNIEDLSRIYSKYFSKDSIETVKYFFQTGNYCAEYEKTGISRLHYAVICRTMHDFIKQYNLGLFQMQSLIDEWFGRLSPINQNKLVHLELSNKVLLSRLKKTLLYRLQESRMFASDFYSKIDFYSAAWK